MLTVYFCILLISRHIYGTVVKQLHTLTFSYKLVYAKEPFGLCPDLIVCPACLPHAQSLSVGELPFEAEQDPAVAEE